MRNEELEKIIPFSLRFGHKVEAASTKSKIEYDNGTTFLSLINSEEMLEDEIAVHNLTHFMCASPMRRYLPDFGLGTSPATQVGIGSLLRFNVAQSEEEATMLLQDLIFKHLNLPNSMASNDTPRNRARLKSWGIIDDQGQLTMEMRNTPDSVTDFTDKLEYDCDPQIYNLYSLSVLQTVFGELSEKLSHPKI